MPGGKTRKTVSRYFMNYPRLKSNKTFTIYDFHDIQYTGGFEGDQSIQLVTIFKKLFQNSIEKRLVNQVLYYLERNFKTHIQFCFFFQFMDKVTYQLINDLGTHVIANSLKMPSLLYRYASKISNQFSSECDVILRHILSAQQIHVFLSYKYVYLYIFGAKQIRPIANLIRSERINSSKITQTLGFQT